MAVIADGKIIALYLRISKRDEEKDDPESNSIGNQRGILYEYVKRHLNTAEYEVREFVDDGYSGTSMNRPAMQELLALAQAGRVYAILVKDLSRFARNYIEAGNYTEKIFPYIGVRFISVNDQYDSERLSNRMPGIDMAFKGILHDYYCKELSQKLKTVRKLQMKKGKSIMAKPPYGYRKSAEEKGLLAVDPEAASVVRMIFESYLGGMSAYKIARELNRKGIDSPNKRLVRAGDITFDREYAEKLCWNTGTVLNILKNQVYIGNAVGNKSERTKISVNRCRKLEESEWIIVENRHEPIIEKEVFKLVQQRLAQNSRPRKQQEEITKQGEEGQIFRGLLICGICNSVMVKSGENKGITYYSCVKCRMAGRKSPIVHSDFLERKLLEELPERFRRELAQEAKGNSKRKVQTVDREAEGDSGSKVQVAEREKTDFRKRQEQKKNRELLNLYEKYADGLLTRQEYQKCREALLNAAAEKAESEKISKRRSGEETAEWDNETEIKIDRKLAERCIDRIIAENGGQVRILWKE